MSESDAVRQARLAAEGFDFEVKGVSELVGGLVNRTLKVETNEGSRVLRVYPETRRTRQIEFEVTLHDAVCDASANVPAVLRDAQGDALRQVGGAPALWFEFIDARALSVEEALLVPAADLGALLRPVFDGLAKVHAPFRPVAETRVFAARLGALLEGLSDVTERETAEDVSVLRDLFEEFENWERTTKLPTGVVHADIHPGNVLRTLDGEVLRASGGNGSSIGGGRLWLIDFDDAHVGIRAQDWVLPALQFSMGLDGHVDETRFVEIFEELAQGRATDEERHAVPRLRQLLTLKSAATLASVGVPASENAHLALLFD